MTLRISPTAQRVLVWWGLIFIVIYGCTLGFLCHMVGPPSPTLTAQQVAAFYLENSFQIRIGAMIASWCSAFMVPLAIVTAVQMARLEKGMPIWAITEFAGGILMSLFLVLPPLFWGIAAYSPERSPEITALAHEFGMLTLTTTDQFYIFQMVAIAVVSLTTSHPTSAFPRWFGWLTIWAAAAFEVGAIAFLPKSGPFSWSGVIVFWMPFCVFGAWVFSLGYTLLTAITRQEKAAATGSI